MDLLKPHPLRAKLALVSTEEPEMQTATVKPGDTVHRYERLNPGAYSFRLNVQRVVRFGDPVPPYAEDSVNRAWAEARTRDGVVYLGVIGHQMDAAHESLVRPAR